jgi:AAHS family 4-hydroxybenzoate transporter-like MFS transporter
VTSSFTPPASRLNLSELIDERPLQRFQVKLLILAFAVIVLDGFDLAIMGFVAPQLRQDWSIGPEWLGIVLSVSYLGQGLGAMFVGPLADRYGRRPMIMGCVLFFGLLTLASALASTPSALATYRFLTGLGLGAAIAITTTLVSEYLPHRVRAFMITLVLCGVSLGASGGGFLSAWMLPKFGWQSVMVLGGVLPVLLTIVLAFMLPESLKFLAAHGRAPAMVDDLVRRIAPDLSRGTYEFVAETMPVEKRNSMKLLFAERYRKATFLLWLVYFCVLGLIYLLAAWLPTLIREGGGGYSISESAIAASMFHIGGPVGSIAIGWMMDRRSKPLVIATALFIAAVSLAVISQMTHHLVAMGILIFVIGFTTIGSSVGIVALSTFVYPTEARATGTSWMITLGRLGATISVMSGAVVLKQSWSLSYTLIILIVPALIATVALGVLAATGEGRTERPHGNLSKARLVD